jgi:GNAT superfamily N-acetyltransferase
MEEARMDDAISCRWARAADFEAVQNLAGQLARHIEEAPPALTREGFAASHLGSEAPMKLLLAEQDGVVVGLASWTVVHELYSGGAGLYISDIVVDGAVRGEGVGHALMEAVQEWARASGIHKLGWDVWRANASAMAFYEGLGAAADREAVPYRLILAEA